MLKQGYKFMFNIPENGTKSTLTNITICIEAARKNYCSYEIVQRIITNYLNKIGQSQLSKETNDNFEKLFSSLAKLSAFNGFELVRMEISTNYNRPIRIARETLTPQKRAELDNILRQINSFDIKQLNVEESKKPHIEKQIKKEKNKKTKSYLMLIVIPALITLFGIISLVLSI